MRRKSRFSTRTFPRAATLGGFLALSACATVSQPAAETLAPLDLALLSEASVLRSQADAGDPQAQLAMSIVTTHGLHGERAAPQAGAEWLSRAMASRGVMPITQYTAAFNGQPSRVNIIHVPISNISPGQVQAIDRCVAALVAASDRGHACGETRESRAARQIAWARARR